MNIQCQSSAAVSMPASLDTGGAVIVITVMDSTDVADRCLDICHSPMSLPPSRLISLSALTAVQSGSLPWKSS